MFLKYAEASIFLIVKLKPQQITVISRGKYYHTKH